MARKLSWFIHETKRRSPVLWKLILIQFAYIVLSLIMMRLDERTIKNGVSPWLKPVVFDSSIIIYVGSMIWVLSELPKDLGRNLARQIAASLFIVTSFIVVQSVRGVKTSFVQSDPTTSTIFVIFGLAIAWNTLSLLRTAFYFHRLDLKHLTPIYKRGIQLGLYSVIVGSFIGHAVYFASIDFNLAARIPGVAGKLPSLTFSSRLGSLRIAHSLGLHGLQIFMILAAIHDNLTVRQKIGESGESSTARPLLLMNALFWIMMIAIGVMLAWATFGIQMGKELL